MYRELLINFRGKETSILIDSLYDDHDRIPCFVIGLSSHYHDKFSERFRDQYQLVLVDLYWTDDSYDKNYIQSLSLNDMASHIEEVRQAMEDLLGERYQKIVMLGHSAYGFLCLEYALSYGSHLYGIINVCTPAYFKEEELQKLQTKYIDSNFGPKTLKGRPDERWIDYYRLREAHQNNIDQYATVSEKETFVRWYISMGPILWKERSFWQDQDGKATALWNPWSIPLAAPKEGNFFVVRDVNMTTFNHFFRRIIEADYQSKLNQIHVLILWFIGLFDARVSLYFFDNAQKDERLLKSTIELYYIDAGHWPMCEEKGVEFDKKTTQWIREIFERDNAYEGNFKYRAKL